MIYSATSKRPKLSVTKNLNWQKVIEGVPCVVCADSENILSDIPPNSVDACITDSPYGIGFLNKEWDAGIPKLIIWKLIFEALKPGAPIMAFASPRTYHLMAAAISAAGFHIADQLNWLYATGMVKGTRLPDGSHTGLKPAHEPIVLARKPCAGTKKSNNIKYGTGGFGVPKNGSSDKWPTNIVHDGSDEVVAALGGLAPFFACAKPSTKEREFGLDDFPLVMKSHDGRKKHINNAFQRNAVLRRNHHPTVKPLALMEWAILRACPTAAAIILDPFSGSGTTGMAASRLGYRFIGIEMCPAYAEISVARIAAAQSYLKN